MYIYATLSNDQDIILYREGTIPTADKINIPVINKKVTIKGDANVSNKYREFPKVSETYIKDEDFEWVSNDTTFKSLVKNGHIVFEKKKRVNFSDEDTINLIVKNMKSKDKSAALTKDCLKNISKDIRESDIGSRLEN